MKQKVADVLHQFMKQKTMALLLHRVKQNLKQKVEQIVIQERSHGVLHIVLSAMKKKVMHKMFEILFRLV